MTPCQCVPKSCFFVFLKFIFHIETETKKNFLLFYVHVKNLAHRRLNVYFLKSPLIALYCFILISSYNTLYNRMINVYYFQCDFFFSVYFSIIVTFIVNIVGMFAWNLLCTHICRNKKVYFQFYLFNVSRSYIFCGLNLISDAHTPFQYFIYTSI